MDEAELEALFRNAANSGPSASFDADDVRRGSRRVTARRRTALAGGTLVAAAVLVGGVGFGTGALGPPGSTVAQAPPPAGHPEPGTGQSPMALPQGPGTPRSGPMTLGDPKGGGECGPDSAVAGALAAELPEAARTSAIGVSAPCPPGARAAAVTLREGTANGKVAVLITPAGGANAAEHRPQGTAVAQVPARSGAVVTVLSQPVGSGGAPFAERVAPLAERIATRF